jgi:hypothetical protein
MVVERNIAKKAKHMYACAIQDNYPDRIKLFQ